MREKRSSDILSWGEKEQSKFWARVKKQVPDGCWEWQSCKVKGYGAYNASGKSLRSHRISYMLTYGAIPDGLLVCHTCDNPACCNPAHLFLGTNADNMHDCVAKGRRPRPVNPKGSDSPQAKLTALEVQAIRNLYASGTYSHRQLARIYGVSHTAIRFVVHRKTYA